MTPTDASFRASAIDAFTLTFVRVAARAGSFLFFVVLAANVEAALVGEYALFLAVALVLTAFVDFGLPTLVTRDVSRISPTVNSPLRTALRIRLALLLVVFSSATLAVWTDLAGSRWFLAVLAAIVLDGYGALLLSGARRDRRMRAIAAVELARSWTALLALLPLWALKTSTTNLDPRAWAYPAFLAGSVLAFLVAVLVSRGFLAEQLRVPAAASPQYWRAGLPLAVATVAVGLNNRVDLIMLNWLSDEVNVAHYAAAYLFVNGAILVPVMASYAVLPALSRAHGESADNFRHLLQSWVRSLAALAAAVGISLAALAAVGIDMLYTQTYLNAANALRVLAIALPAMFLSNLCWNALVVVGRQKAIVVYILVAALGNCLANFLLIPRIGILGAATSTVLAESLVVLLASLALNPYFPRAATIGAAARAVASVASASTVAWASTIWGLPGLGVLLSLVAGVAIAWALGVIRSADVGLAYRTVRGMAER